MILTKEILEQYGLLGKELKRLEEKLEYYSNYQLPSEHGVVKGSMKDFPYAETHFVLSGSDIQKDDELQTKIRQLLITVRQKREELLLMQIDIETEIENIPDIEMRQIIESHFIKGKTYREIGAEMFIDYSAVSKKITNFLEKHSAKAQLQQNQQTKMIV